MRRCGSEAEWVSTPLRAEKWDEAEIPWGKASLLGMDYCMKSFVLFFCCGQRMMAAGLVYLLVIEQLITAVRVPPSAQQDKVKATTFLGPFLGCAGRVRITTRPFPASRSTRIFCTSLAAKGRRMQKIGAEQAQKPQLSPLSWYLISVLS